MSTLPTPNTPYYGGGQVKNPANVIILPNSLNPPTVSSGLTLGSLAVNNTDGLMWGLVSLQGGAPTWAILGGGTGAVDNISGDTGIAVPVGSSIKIAGGSNITTSAASNIVTVNVSGTTVHSVQIGDGTGALKSVPNGTTGQVLKAVSGGDPVWGSDVGIVTLSADSGSATGNPILISGGSTGITTTASGSTLSLTGVLLPANGGTGATTLTGVLTGNGTSAITASAVTNHGVVIGAASNAVGSTSVGASGTVLIGNTAGDPTFSASCLLYTSDAADE